MSSLRSGTVTHQWSPICGAQYMTELQEISSTVSLPSFLSLVKSALEAKTRIITPNKPSQRFSERQGIRKTLVIS